MNIKYCFVFYDELSLDAFSCASLAASAATRLRFRQAFKYVTGAIGNRPDKPFNTKWK